MTIASFEKNDHRQSLPGNNEDWGDLFWCSFIAFIFRFKFKFKLSVLSIFAQLQSQSYTDIPTSPENLL